MTGDGLSPDQAARRASSGGMTKGAKQAGAIVLARHGEPALSRKARMNAADYGAWWAAVRRDRPFARAATPPPA